MTSTPQPLIVKQIPTGQPTDVMGVVSSETGFDSARLSAYCSSVKGLERVIKPLQQIHTAAERVSWCKDRCRKLSNKAIALVYIICDQYGNEVPEGLIEQIVQNMFDIASDVSGWADLSYFKSWYMRDDIDAKITKHEANLGKLTESGPVSAHVKTHDKVATLQASLNTTANNSPDRKRVEEQLYRLRSAPPAESADSTPPELAQECVRLGTQPEHSGSSNEIWKGRWLNTQDVALILFKQYKLDTRDEKAILRFERQIKVWRKLDNPFVLRLYGWCKFQEETYLVSPWLRNGDVVKYLDGNRSRDQKCLSLVHEIAQGLHYLHTNSIIHGSLNPSNILVGDDHCAVISDFSFAKVATPDAKNTQRTPQVNAFRYQAPEVILDKPISKASDIYSWAMTALEIITGNPPYHTQRSPGQLLTELTIKNKYPNRSDYNSPVLNNHPEIWELFSECWRREQKERPTAERVVEVLGKILSPK